MNDLSMTSLSPEMKLVLCTIQVEQSRQNFEWKKLKKNINWPLVTDLVIQHGVLPLVYKFLKKQNKGMVSQSDLDKQKNLYLNNVGRNILVIQKLLDILKMLSAKGYQAVPFKGPVIAVQAYGDIGLRTFCDLDLLIRSGDFPFIYDLIESEGYLSVKPMIGNLKSIWKISRRNFEFQGKNFFIDFHQQISQGPSFLDLKDAFQNLSSVELLSKQVPTLNIHGTIMILVLHGTHHGWSILKMVADLAHLIHLNEPEIKWNVLVEKARVMGSLRMLMIGLLLGQNLCGLEIPPMIKDLIERDKKIEKLVVYFTEKILEKKKSNRIPVTAIPRALDSWYYKLRYWLYYIFNPTNLDVLAIRLPAFLYPVYYLVRPVRLVINLGKEAVNKIVKRKA